MSGPSLSTDVTENAWNSLIISISPSREFVSDAIGRSPADAGRSSSSRYEQSTPLNMLSLEREKVELQKGCSSRSSADGRLQGFISQHKFMKVLISIFKPSDTDADVEKEVSPIGRFIDGISPLAILYMAVMGFSYSA